jgi:hypothetical protein
VFERPGDQRCVSGMQGPHGGDKANTVAQTLLV